MAKTLIVIEIEHSADIPVNEQVEAVKGCLKNNGHDVLHVQAVATSGPSLREQFGDVFSQAEPEGEAKTIPYQEKATLQSSMAGQYMDVLGNDGRVLASFEKPDVRRVWGEMNR